MRVKKRYEDFEGYKLDEATKKLINKLEECKWRPHEGMELPEGFKKANNGISRLAFVGPNFVVKKPYTSGREPRKIRKCPTKNLTKAWVIQPKCKVFAELTYYKRKKFLDQGLVYRDSDGGLSLTRGGDDAHAYNFGLLNKKLVQFDW